MITDLVKLSETSNSIETQAEPLAQSNSSICGVISEAIACEHEREKKINVKIVGFIDLSLCTK